MLFNSYIFLCAFLPLTLAGFAWLAARGRDVLVSLWLIGASLLFYGWWNPAYLPLLVGSLLFNYQLARLLAVAGGRRRVLLGIGIAGNLGLLGYFKYADFFARNLNALVGTSWHFEILLPLAISFFTFQQIAYLVDVAGSGRPEPSLRRYALFVTFFPQLIAGPIVRHDEMLPQLRRRRWRLDPDDLAAGLFVFGVGLVKKVVVADGVAPHADAIFGAAEAGIELTLFEAWLGALAYTVQIYFDFSGYSDMAVGLGRMFGLRLPMNFNAPYQAGSIIGFWRRWHMTLSRFLRDYLYVPLGGNRHGARWRHVNLLVTMLLGGLWHGAAWTFVVWGGLHGLYLGINHAWRRFRTRRGWRPGVGGPPVRLLGWGLTFAAVVVAWVFFRATSLAGAFAMLEAMLGGNGLALSSAFESRAPWLASIGVITFEGMFHHALVPTVDALLGVGLALLIALTMPSVYAWLPAGAEPFPVYDEVARPSPRRRPTWQPGWRWGMVAGAVLALGVLGVSEENEFLYFNF